MTDFEALTKSLLNHPRPSETIETQISEITRLKQVPQDRKHHPEGNAYIHSMQVLDRAADIRAKIPKKDQLVYMLAAWLHDVGKWDNTFYRGENKKKLTHWSKKKPRNTRIVSYGHDFEGARLVAKILENLECPSDINKRTCQLVAFHMKPLLLRTSKLKSFKKLSTQTTDLFLIGMISWADKGTRPDNWFEKIEELKNEEKNWSDK